ncbi:hypothetical protein SDC9_197995 [bioreactor metagenome]|uniref:Uncharacterized protein n=1 Tax=bioreactor metagenome TaxID=1076179 RepID=A0A645IIR3_9ZZZZ
MTQIDQHAVEACLTLFVRHILQGMQQLFQVLLIARVFTGIARGVDARRAAQRVNGQTGVVGNRR